MKYFKSENTLIGRKILLIKDRFKDKSMLS